MQRGLQWGRGLLTPEICLHVGGGAGGAPASMGPGSFDPGNVFFADALYGGGPLQWGRGLLTPEIRVSSSRGGAREPASMGPGSFDPGNIPVPPQHVPQPLASMGPGSFDPGNRMMIRKSGDSMSRFNGAGVF